MRLPNEGHWEVQRSIDAAAVAQWAGNIRYVSLRGIAPEPTGSILE
jgi:hypothetical protein